MNKVYTRIEWKNYPSTDTAVNEANLNKMDFAIDEIDKRVVEQDITKANVSALNELITSWTIDKNTGVITIYKVSGEQIIFDLNIEKVPVGFSLTDDGILIMTTDDGTEFTANIGSMIPVLTFEDSEQIAVKVSGEGVNKTYSFSIKTGSITADKLQPNFLADVTLQANNAKTSEQNAKTSEENAKQSEINAKNYADSTEPVASTVSGLNPTLDNSTDAPIISMQIDGETTQDGTPTPDAPVEIHGVGESGSLEVKSTGKNIFGGLPFAQALVDSGSTNVSLNADDKIITYNYNTNYNDNRRGTLFNNFKENTEYTFITNSDTYPTGTDLNILCEYTDTTTEWIKLGVWVSRENKTIKRIRYSYYSQHYVTLNYEQCGIFEGVITADEFEPYTENTANIPLDAPLYEGDYIKYNMDGSGELVRKMASVVFNGSEDWNKNSSFETNYLYYVMINDKKKVSNIWCDRLSHKKVSILNEEGGNIDHVGCNGNEHETAFYINVGYYMSENTVTALRAWLQANPITVVYELAEPTVKQLTEEQIAEFKKLYSFDGVTNVMCEGETEIDYFRDNVNGRTVAMVVKMVKEAI